MQQYNIIIMVETAESYWIYRVQIKLSHSYIVRLKFKPIQRKKTYCTYCSNSNFCVQQLYYNVEYNTSYTAMEEVQIAVDTIIYILYYYAPAVTGAVQQQQKRIFIFLYLYITPIFYNNFL